MSTDFAAEPSPRRPRASLVRAVQRFVDATQSLVADRTDLLRVEAGADVREAVKSLRRGVAGGLFLTAGWVLLIAALLIWLSRYAEPEVVLAAVGGAHALVGLFLVVRAERSER